MCYFYGFTHQQSAVHHNYDQLFGYSIELRTEYSNSQLFELTQPYHDASHRTVEWVGMDALPTDNSGVLGVKPLQVFAQYFTGPST